MFLKSHYFWRTYLGYVIVALIGTFLFSASLISRMESQLLAELDTKMDVTAQLLATAVAPNIQVLDYQAVRDTAASVAESSALRITVIDERGIVLADSGLASPGLAIRLSEMRAALKPERLLLSVPDRPSKRVVLFPGVPREMRGLFREQLMPRLETDG